MTWLPLCIGLNARADDGQDSGKIPTRDEIERRYRWDLTDVYADPKAWAPDLDKTIRMLGELKAQRDKIDSADALATVLRLRDETSVLVEKVFAYAMLSHHQDTDDKAAQANFNRANDLLNRFREETAWLIPNLLRLPQETVTSWIDSTAELKVYRHWWDDVQRQRPHFRNAAEEELLAMAGAIADGPEQTFSLLTNADLDFGTIQDDNGAEVELSSPRYYAAIYSPDRRYRKDAFFGLHRVYLRHRNTIASLLNTQVKRDLYYARARHYANALEAALGPNAIPVSVYDNLVTVINQHLPLLHRYTQMRKRVLKLDKLHAYDLYVSLVPQSQEEVPYDEAVKTILDALSTLHPEYTTPMRKAFASRWIDVYETKNKRGGAYCMGIYAAHPYLLLNYGKTANARSTVAHEMGHAMHTWFTQHAQPIVYGDYSIFCAEVASTVNEALLNDYLLKRATSDRERLRLINASLENIRTTVFRQTLFAEFERTIHEMAEQGKPLVSDAMFQVYRELNKRYYGPALVIDDVLDAECLRIPHFYRNFYVYQYATSYCAATNIARRILARQNGAVEGLMKFLKAGSSDYPIEVLKLAGVDTTTPQPFLDTMRLFGEQLDEMERLLEKIGPTEQ